MRGANLFHPLDRWEHAGNRLEAKLDDWGDYLNPILVKETRQALKSRQFLLTFTLVLGACWVTTMAGIAIIGPAIYYVPSGGEMLLAYYTILAFPLAVVVPFSAFRSLVSEREDNTYDVLAVSTLSPTRIVAGKLASAVVQMMVYLSATAPCIAFTYLLRGIDVFTIAMLIVYAVFGSLGLSMLSLMLAAQSKQRYGQMILSVALVILLLLAFWGALGGGLLLVQEGNNLLQSPEFWTFNAALLTGYVTTFVLLFAATTGLMGYESSNRSTPLRLAMLLQYVCLAGWMTIVWIEARCDNNMLVAFAAMAGVYWFAMGSMVTGESPEMSRRVMRSLPDTLASRALFTWLMPGPGLGLMFTLANLASVAVLVMLGMALGEMFQGATSVKLPGRTVLLFLLLGGSYVTAYLCLGKLITSALRRFAEVTLLGGFLINSLLVLAGSGIPYSIHMSSASMRGLPYSKWQLANPFWSLSHVLDTGVINLDILLMLTIVPPLAICLFLLNFPSLAAEMGRGRIALPERIVEDERELHPPRPVAPTSPWDVPDDDEFDRSPGH